MKISYTNITKTKKIGLHGRKPVRRPNLYAFLTKLFYK